MDTKVCKKCGLEKSLDLFYNDKKSKDGKCFRCKVCMNVTTYANYEKKRKPKKDWSTDPGFKICRKCLEKKPVGDFNIHFGKTRTKDKLRNECRECQKTKSRTHYLKIKDEWNRKRRENKLAERPMRHNSHLKKMFNISLLDYNDMLKKQDGKCAICGSDKPSAKGDKIVHFAVDHNHETGEIRSLLCIQCNQGLGQFKDSPELLQKAIEYLKTFNRTLGA